MEGRGKQPAKGTRRDETETGRVQKYGDREDGGGRGGGGGGKEGGGGCKKKR